MKHTDRNCLKCNTLVCKNIQNKHKFTKEEILKINDKKEKPLVFNKITLNYATYKA